MKQISTLLVLIFFLNSGLSAQTITGILKDASDQSALTNATINLLKKDSSKTNFSTVSNSNGNFSIKDVTNGEYILSVSYIGYENFKKAFSISGQNVNLGSLLVSKSAEVLTEVVISGTPPPVKQRNDTLEYSANQYKLNPDATGEDLLKKMPGITVDKTGSVTAQGENVKKVTVDGRDFFGDDATATLRNLPSEIIDKIQVFDKLSDQSQLTGFDDGNSEKSINIVTKKDMRAGNFGRVFAGYGSDDRYSAGGNISFFNNARRISFIGLTNNVNQQNFSSQDLLGATTTGNRGGGGARGGGGGSNFMVGQQSGISKTNAIGVNYSDAWGKKINVSGSYFFNNSNTNNDQTINRQNFRQNDSTQFYDENTLSNTENYNNRVNFRFDYKIDSSNSLLITTGLNFQKNNSSNLVSGINYYDAQNLISQTGNNLVSDISGYTLNNNVLFRHAFSKKGRSISIGFGTNVNNNNGQTYIDALNNYYKTSIVSDTTHQLADRKSNSTQYNINLVYTETVGKKAQLQVNYNPTFQKSSADQKTFDLDNSSSKYSKIDTSLSNIFDNTYNTQSTGVTYRYGDKDNMLSAGVTYQYSQLKSNQVFPAQSNIDNTYSNFLANAMARIKLSSKSNLRLMYRGRVSPPSVNQLQNVINNSNPLFFSTGNPDLQQQYTNNLVARYTYTNSVKGQSLFANIFLSSIDNYISNATYTATKDSMLTNSVVLRKGSQLSKPINLSGYYSVRSFFTFGTPIKAIKSNLNLNAGFSYSRLPGLLNNVSNISDNYNYNVGAVVSSNISQYVDFTLSYSANMNNVKNSIRPDLNNNYYTQSLGFTANFLTKGGTFFQNDISNQSYKGLTDGFNQSYWLWNMAVGQKFLKNQDGELKLSVFDLLKQNSSITRDVTESYIQDVRNKVLQQYFMLTFTYKLKTFGKGKVTNTEEKRMPSPYGGGFGGNHPS
jgi:hypothetical protein